MDNKEVCFDITQVSVRDLANELARRADDIIILADGFPDYPETTYLAKGTMAQQLGLLHFAQIHINTKVVQSITT